MSGITSDSLSLDRIDRASVLLRQKEAYETRLDTLETNIDTQTNREINRIIYSSTQPSSDTQNTGDFWREKF